VTLVTVFRSTRVVDMYLYVAESEGLERVPQELLQRFGSPVQAMNLQLTTERKLARADAAAVIESIADRGFYLQLPPNPEDWNL
jgi:uncharacterized protein YcgL (UPF0745 family)